MRVLTDSRCLCSSCFSVSSLTQERGVRVQGSSSNPFDANQCLVKDTRAARGLADRKKRPSTVRRGSGFPSKQALVLLSSPAEGNW